MFHFSPFQVMPDTESLQKPPFHEEKEFYPAYLNVLWKKVVIFREPKGI